MTEKIPEMVLEDGPRALCVSRMEIALPVRTGTESEPTCKHLRT